MGYKYEGKLKEKANEYIKDLSNNGLKAEIEMYRDYLVKLSLSVNNKDCGYLNIYYKPTKESYSLKTYELRDESIEEEVRRIWANKDLNGCNIYVDGSYINGKVGYGYVVIRNGEKVAEISGQISDPLYKLYNQVGGEIKAVEEAINWARKNEINSITIYHDFENLEKWANGEYKANNPLTKEYCKIFDDVDIEIKWNKVASHTGDRWNEYADKLAKKGTGVHEKVNKDYLQELKEYVEGFRNFLNLNGFTAQICNIEEDDYARAKMEVKFEEELGFINFYNTKNKHLIARFHEIKDNKYLDELKKLWSEFKSSQN